MKRQCVQCTGPLDEGDGLICIDCLMDNELERQNRRIEEEEKTDE